SKALNPQGTAPSTAPSAGAGLPGGESLVGMIEKLTTAVNTKDKAIAKQDADLKALAASVKTRVDGWNAQYEELNKKFADADKRATDAQATLAAAQQEYQKKQSNADESNKSTIDTTA